MKNYVTVKGLVSVQSNEEMFNLYWSWPPGGNLAVFTLLLGIFLYSQLC